MRAEFSIKVELDMSDPHMRGLDDAELEEFARERLEGLAPAVAKMIKDKIEEVSDAGANNQGS